MGTVRESPGEVLSGVGTERVLSRPSGCGAALDRPEVGRSSGPVERCRRTAAAGSRVGIPAVAERLGVTDATPARRRELDPVPQVGPAVALRPGRDRSLARPSPPGHLTELSVTSSPYDVCSARQPRTDTAGLAKTRSEAPCRLVVRSAASVSCHRAAGRLAIPMPPAGSSPRRTRSLPKPTLRATSPGCKADQDRGQWLDPRVGRITFAAWAEQWLASNPSKRVTTRARDETVLRTHFLPSLGDLRLAAITPAHVRSTVDAMTASLAPATVRTNLGVVRAVLNAAVDADLIGRSPVRGVRAKKGEARERPTLTPEELERLADAIGPRYRALVLVGGVLGLRWSLGDRASRAGHRHCAEGHRRPADDLRGRGSAVDRGDEEPSLPPHDQRAAVPGRRAPGAPRGREGRREADDLLFTGPKRTPLRRSFAARMFAPAVERAGLDPALTFHGLRHVATTLMVEAGEHPRVIQAPTRPRHRSTLDGIVRPCS